MVSFRACLDRSTMTKKIGDPAEKSELSKDDEVTGMPKN